ncbi:hypothetical protein BGX38DRAFT_161891 [Terfezia claveryi]|nr:hypothetical protein BGX38DRAFT_161891 [Terfezia claveryi]
MASPESIARLARAPASLTLAEKTYILSTTNGELVEKSFDGGEWSLPNLLAKVKANAAVAYVQGAPQRTIVSINSNGVLEDYTINSRGKGSPGKLSSANITPHTDSKLAAVYSNGQYHVFYQAPDGQLIHTSSDRTTWNTGSPLTNATPVEGTALDSAATEDHKLHVGYQHQDSSIHLHTYDNGTWTDHVLPNGNVDDSLDTLRILNQSEEGDWLAIYQTKHRVVVVASAKEINVLGTNEEDGNFKAASSAECGRFIFIWGNRGIINIR